ncbi:MAG: L-aspartate oxidase [Bacteroidetes bacterium]|nr:L-aspartate oxidase [Bacteroidota bacterium]
MKIQHTDILIIGSGVAGLNTAIRCAEFADVVVVTKGKCAESSTRLAQGGLACVTSETDNFEKHIQDTWIAGGKKGNLDAIRVLVEEAPFRIRELTKLGLNFDMQKSGEPDLAKEAGHSESRVLHVGDSTGKSLETILIENAKSNPNIQFMENVMARDLFLEEGLCRGAWIWNPEISDYIVVKAKYTVLATGGAGRIYQRTTNPAVATGDGFAMAARAGVKLENMSYVQFHPTALFHPKAKGFLISEALRGAGAELVLPNGEKFMHRYHPDGSMAPRDVVSASIWKEMKSNAIDHVFLDVSNISESDFLKKFPMIYHRCRKLGINIPADRIPVAPAAHYMCGGIKTDLFAKTSMPHLYAVGETASTGVHGANRLASNSLLEGLVFSHRCANNIFAEMQKFEGIIACPIPFFVFRKEHSTRKCALYKKKITGLMGEFAIPGATKSALEYALKEMAQIAEIAEEWTDICAPDKQVMELRNMAATATLVIQDALAKVQPTGNNENQEKQVLKKLEIPELV